MDRRGTGILRIETVIVGYNGVNGNGSMNAIIPDILSNICDKKCFQNIYLSLQ